MRNLPTNSFKKAINNAGCSYVNFWYLKYFERVAIINDTLYMYLWIYEIFDNTYPVKVFGKNSLRIRILAHEVLNYVLGSIYDVNGEFIREPKKNEIGLQELEISLNNSENYCDKGLFEILKKTYFRVVPFEYKMYIKYPYYLSRINYNNKEIEVIVPLQLILKFFFLGISSGLNYKILRDQINDCVIKTGIEKIKDDNGEEIRFGKYLIDLSKISIYQARSIAKYMYTSGNAGLQALNLLRRGHLDDFRIGYEETYLKGKIPFDFACAFSILGQFIDSKEKIFMAHKITGFHSDRDLYTIDILEGSVRNDTMSTSKYMNEKIVKTFQPLHTYIRYGDATEEATDHSSPIKTIKNQVEEGDIFDLEPEFLEKRIGINQNKYSTIGAPGKFFDSGSLNYDDEDRSSSTNREDYTNTNLQHHIAWDKCAKRAIIYLCENYHCTGSFIKINNSNQYIGIESVTEELEIFAKYISKEKEFNFILFEFYVDNSYYYYFDSGTGNLSAIFYHWANDNKAFRMDLNKLNLVIMNVVRNYNLRWSDIRTGNKLFRDNIKVFQPFKHNSLIEKNIENSNDRISRTLEESENILIKKLAEKIRLRLKVRKRF